MIVVCGARDALQGVLEAAILVHRDFRDGAEGVIGREGGGHKGRAEGPAGEIRVSLVGGLTDGYRCGLQRDDLCRNGAAR